MIRKTLLLAPFGLMMLATAWGCGGAATSPDDPNGDSLAAGANNGVTQETTPPEQANPAEQAKPGDNVGQTQQKWLGAYPGFGYGYPGFGYAYSYPYSYGYSPYGYGYGYGIGRSYGYGSSISCVNGFCY